MVVLVVREINKYMSKEFGNLSQAIETQRETGVMTDQWLLPKFFQLTKGTEVHLVATDSFIGKSKDQYNAAWLSRELIQNFVDHNPDDQGTLNGVEISTEDLPASKDMPKGGKRIIIKGNWKFENPTGVISPHSEKPADTETAGGNGIGLKQSALRMLRDFGAKKFEIEGEGWKVDYGMIKKDEVNQTIQDNLPEMESARVRHDWLVADLSKTKNSGTNSYVIETDNQELIASLSELPNLGVSEKNKYLQDLDLNVKTGDKKSIALKWLQPEEKGRLFLNGQVMNYEKNGTSSDDYWRGPEGLSISLKGVKYKMSIDRPPVDKFDFGSYLENFVKKLSTQQLTEQLQKSYHLWRGTLMPSYARKGFMVAVDSMVEALQKRKDYTSSQFKELFPEKLLANDTGLEKKDIQKLEKDGYVVCDEIFGKIGMEKASQILKPDESLVREKRPDNPSGQIEKLAEEMGLQVYFQEYGHISTSDFINKIDEFVKKYSAKIEITKEGIKIIIPEGVHTETLYAQIPYPKKNLEQKLIFELRSLIKHGLQNELFDEHSHTTNADVVTTYKSDISFACGDREQTLIIRNTRIRPKKYTKEKLLLEATLLFGKKLTAEQIESFLKNINQSTKITPAKTDSIKARLDLASHTNIPSAYQKPNWLKRTLVVLGIGAIGAIGTYEASQPTGVAAIKKSSDDDQTLKKIEPVGTTIQQTNIDQIKKQKEANEKFSSFINQHPNALIGGSDFGKTEITSVRKHTATVESASTVRDTEQKSDQHEETDQIEDFEPLTEITVKQTEQLKVLTAYLELTTDAKLSGKKFFIFKGKGALGVNHGKQFIGLHEAMFETNFFEALSTLIHEAAHCDPEANGHDNQFRHTMQDMFSAALEKEHFDVDPNSKESTFRKRWEQLRLNK